MNSVIWSGAGNASEVFLLVAIVVAAVDALMLAVKGAPEAALLPIAVGLIALALLAV